MTEDSAPANRDHSTPVLRLLCTRRCLPICLSQSCTALNDNLVRNALVVLALFQAGSAGPVLVALAAGLFMAPYILLSATAGQLADSYDKAWLIRVMKLAEIGLMSVAALGFLTDSLAILLFVLVALGVQASFFGPLKYGILPDHLFADELVAGNSLIEATTFLAILVGTMAGGWLVLLPNGRLMISIAGLAVALCGLASAFAIPTAPPRSAPAKVDWRLGRATMALVRQARVHPGIWQPIIGISWFWTLGATLVAQFPVVAAATLHASGEVVTLFLTMFSLGIGAGSLLCARVLKGEASARYVPISLLGISVFTFDFAITCATAHDLTSVGAIVTSFAGLRILLELMLLSACGGFYSVPLYVMIQHRAEPAWRARMVAANNVVNAAFMVAGAAVAAVLAAIGATAPHILVLTAIVNLVAVVWSLRYLPRHTLQAVLRFYARLFHGVTVRGLENLPPPGQRAVIAPNHFSFADGPLLAAFLPGDPVFVIDTFVATRWWVRPFLSAIHVFRVDPLNPYAVRDMIRAVQGGRRLVLFPEGRISQTGGLMKIYDGAGMIADRANGVLVPVRIEGTQFSLFSRLKGKVPRRWFPRVSITVLPPVRLALDPDLLGRRRRQAAAEVLAHAMTNATFMAQTLDHTLFTALLAAGRSYGWRMPVLQDADRMPMNYRRLLLAACVLGRGLTSRTRSGEYVGLLLPNAIGAVATFMALQAFGRVPAMLNVTAGAEGMLAACRSAGVRIVVSSRRFAAHGKLQREIDRMARDVTFVWLEELRDSLGRRARLRGWIDALLPGRLPGSAASPDAPAAILFTSGTEGTPKGVALSHRNILANCAQARSVVDFTSIDRVFNALPMFHAFGLTVGSLLPLLHGVPTFLYPTPLHYRLIPELIYGTDATIVFGSDTFLAGWARYAHPYDFRSVRYLLAGAERLKESTRRLYADRFGVRVFEGYGTTETAPVLSINLPMHNAPGSAGRFMPGIEWRLEPVEGVDEGGRLWVRGPNVMLGYLHGGVLEPLPTGWYDTGDIVVVDAAGFVWIKDRAKRFAKIGGEMVSMTVGEALAASIWPDDAHAVVALGDMRKGERLVLVTSRLSASPQELLRAAQAQGIPELVVPRMVLPQAHLPRLGSGKLDYAAVQRVAEAELAAMV